MEKWRQQEKPWMCQFCALTKWLKQKLSSGSTKIPSVIYFSCMLFFREWNGGRFVFCRLTWSFIYRHISDFSDSLKYEALEFRKDHYFLLKYLFLFLFSFPIFSSTCCYKEFFFANSLERLFDIEQENEIGEEWNVK